MKIIFLIFCFHFLIYASETTKIKVQFKWLDQFEFAGYYIAKEKGFYKDKNLDVEFLKFDSSVDIVKNVISKKADFGISSSSLIIEKSKNKDILLLAAIFQSSPLVLLSLKEKLIHSVSDLKDKKIMLANDQENFATIKTMLNAGNINKNDINIIPHTFNVQDLLNGTADVMTAYTTNELLVLDEMDMSYNILHPKDYGFDFYEDILFTTNKFYKENPKIVEDFVKATLKGWEYSFEHIEETAKLIKEKYNPQDKSLSTLINEANEMKKLVFDKNGKIGTIDEDKIKLIANSYLLMQMMNRNINTKKLIFNPLELLNFNEKSYLKHKEYLSFCVEPDYFPISKIINNKPEGLLVEYIKIVEEKLGIPLRFVNTVDWSQSLKFVKNNKCDLLFGVMQTKNREEYLSFTKPFISSSLVTVTKIDKPYFENFTDLIKNHKIGLIKKYAHTELIKRRYPNTDIVIVDSKEEAYKKILDNEIFGLVDSIYTTSYEIDKKYIGSLKISGQLDFKLNLSVASNKENQTLVDIVDKVLQDVDENQKTKIVNKWLKLDLTNVKKQEETLIVKSILIIVILSLFFTAFYLRERNKKQELINLIDELKKKNEELDKTLTLRLKQATMGDMIDTISHQWKQPLNELGLQFLKLNTDMKFLNKTPNKEELSSFIEKGDSILEFMSKTIDIFRNFFKSNNQEEVLNLRESLKDTILFFDSTFKEVGIEFEYQMEEDIFFKCKKEELFNIMLCLINNSKEAIIKNKINQGFIKITLKKVSNKILIEVEDNTLGIDSTLLEKVFEYKFSTKENNGGLGLFIVKKIVEEKLKGEIKVENIDNGVKFLIILENDSVATLN